VKHLRFSGHLVPFVVPIDTCFVSIQGRKHAYLAFIWRGYLSPSRTDTQAAESVPEKIGIFVAAAAATRLALESIFISPSRTPIQENSGSPRST